MTRLATLLVALFAFPLAANAAEGDEAPTVQQVYAKNCQNCHGPDGKAQTRMGKRHEIKSFVDAAWQSERSDDKLRSAITDGVADTKMKAYKEKLTPAQIDALVQHVRALGKAAPKGE